MEKSQRRATKSQRERIEKMMLSGQIGRAEAQEIIEKPRAQLVSVSNEHYSQFVTYEKLECAKLDEEFDGGGYLRFFEGSWRRHESCEHIDTTSGMRTFYITQIPQEFFKYRATVERVWEELTSWYADLGYRYSIESELIEFAAAHPKLNLQKLHEWWLLALGSSKKDSEGKWCVAEYKSTSIGCAYVREPQTQRIQNDLLKEGQFLLLVRKDV